MKATEKHKEQMKKWNKNHRENVRIAQKKYYETHKEYFKQYNRTRFKNMQQRINKAIEELELWNPKIEILKIERDALINILRGEDND